MISEVCRSVLIKGGVSREGVLLRRTDLRINVHGQKLTSLDQAERVRNRRRLTLERKVILNVKQEPALAENVFGIDNPG